MRVGNIEAKPGEHAFGFLEVAKSRSGLSPDIPVHVFAGTDPGPTLLVQGAIHGAEIIGTMAILNFIKKIDPRGLCGNIIAVPVVNRAGFELSDRAPRSTARTSAASSPATRRAACPTRWPTSTSKRPSARPT